MTEHPIRACDDPQRHVSHPFMQHARVWRCPGVTEQPAPRRVDTSGCATRRASIIHLLDRAGRGVLSVSEAELLRVQVEAELRVSDLRSEQAEADRDKACTAFNSKVMELDQAKRNQLGDFETISYWTSQTALAREYSYWADRARAATILQARKQHARAEQAEAAIERVRAALGDAEWGGPDRHDVITEIRAALDEPKEPRT